MSDTGKVSPRQGTKPTHFAAADPDEAVSLYKEV